MDAHAYVGPYRILRLINRGGQGSVFLGYDGRLRRRVAIKIFRLPGGIRARRALFREARALASMDSPRLVAVHDLIESPEHLALVMEYVPGCDLEEFLQSRRPSLASVITIASDIAAALAVARKHRLIHGDVKAANVLITDAGRARLTDFGISRKCGGDLVGTGSPSAISPEQYLGDALDTRSDLFALGSLLYRMLAGEAPFHRGDELDVAWLLGRPPLPLRDRVAPEYEAPEELLAMVMQLLARQPEDRPSTARPLRSLLREVKRAMPLSQDNNLLAEARLCFRPESPEDIPPPVPSDIGRGSRSRMPRGDKWATLDALGWQKTALVSLLVLAVALPAGVIALQDRQTLVYIDAPSMDLEKSTDLPPAVSAPWLVEQVKASLNKQFRAMRVDGPIGATPVTVLRADGEHSTVVHEEHIELFLHCREQLCALVVSREHEGDKRIQQATLLPGMSQAQCADAVRSAADRLYE